MDKEKLINSGKEIAKSVSMTLKDHAPEICQVIGIVGIGVGTVMACKATLKLKKVSRTNELDLAQTRSFEYNNSRNRGKELTFSYMRCGWRYTKLYGLSGMVLSGSTFLLCYSAKMWKDRYIGVSALYTALSNTFSAYRGRAIDRFGKEVDAELLTGTRKETIKEKVVDEDGKTKTVKKEIDILDAEVDQNLLVYEFGPTWPDGSKNYLWSDDRDHMVAQLGLIESELNEKLDRRAFNKAYCGKMSLSEVLNKLQIPRDNRHNKEAELMERLNGYTATKDPNGVPHRISFGIHDCRKAEMEDFINHERDTLLIEINPPIPLLGI